MAPRYRNNVVNDSLTCPAHASARIITSASFVHNSSDSLTAPSKQGDIRLVNCLVIDDADVGSIRDGPAIIDLFGDGETPQRYVERSCIASM